jgi:hypothetical protein
MLSRQDIGDILHTTRTRTHEIEVAVVIQHDQFTADTGITLLTSTPNTIATFDTNRNLVSKNIEDIILPTNNQVSVSGTGDNEVTLTTPQDVGITSNLVFDKLSLTGTLNATSMSTGTLTVQGGSGIAHDIHAGGHYYSVDGILRNVTSVGSQYTLQTNGDGDGSFGGSSQYVIDNSINTMSKLSVVSPDATVNTSLASDQSENTGKLMTSANAIELWTQGLKSANITNGSLSLFSGGVATTITADGSGNMGLPSNPNTSLVMNGGCMFGGPVSSVVLAVNSLIRLATNGVNRIYIQSGVKYPTATFYPIYFTPCNSPTDIVYIMGATSMTIYPTTSSTSASTGSLVVSGGVSVGNNWYVGESTDATSPSTGCLVLSGGVSIKKALYIGSTSISTGALVVSGGASFNGSLYTGASIYPGNNNTGFSTHYTDTFTYTPLSGTFNGVTLIFKFSRIDDLVFCTFATAMTTGVGGNTYFSVTSAQLGTGSGGGTYTERYAPSVGNESYITGLIYASGVNALNTNYFGNDSINVYSDVNLDNFNGLSNNGLVHQMLSYRL